MSNFYISADTIGNNVCTRLIKDGVEYFDKVPFQPTLYHKTQDNAPTGFKDIYGANVKAKMFESISEARDWSKSASSVNMEVLGNQNYDVQYLHETYSEKVNYEKSKIRIAFVDIEVHATDGFPFPEICNWEIDAITHYDSVDDKFYVFSIRNWESFKANKAMPEDVLKRIVYQKFSTERDMMLHYVSFWQKKFPAIVSGWNSEGFDIPYIVNRLKKLFGETAPNRLSPWGKVTKKETRTQFGDTQITYKISGVASLDYMLLYRKFTFVTRPSYKLDYIAKVELGANKLEYEGKLWELALKDPQTYIDYNIIDVDLLIKLDERLRLMDLVLSLSYYAKMNFSSVMSPIVTWDCIIYGSLMGQNIIVPENKRSEKTPYEGAYVKDPILGMHDWVASVDLASLYPHLIMQYNISPETIRGSFMAPNVEELIDKRFEWDRKDLSCAANGMMYCKDIYGIIPAEIEKMFYQRKEAKGNEFKANFLATKCKKVIGNATGDSNAKLGSVESYFDYTEQELMHFSPLQLQRLIKAAEAAEKFYNVEQMVRKVNLNSLYGALGNENFRLFDIRNASAITISGQLSIRWIERKLNEYFNQICGTTDYEYVVYVDTDSNYIRVGKVVELLMKKMGTTEEAYGKDAIVNLLDKFFKTKVEPFIEKSYQELAEYMNAYAQKMSMDREVIADKAAWTGKKRYIMNVYCSEGKRQYNDDGSIKPKPKIMGLETQRSSTPPFVQKALKESIRIMLQEGEDSLKGYFSEVETEYNSVDYRELASVSSANNLMKNATADMFPTKGCVGHVKAALAHNRAANRNGVDLIQSGDKIAILHLQQPNRWGLETIAYPAGEKLPDEFGIDANTAIDRRLMFEKHFVKPLTNITEAIGWDYEEKVNLSDLFGF